MKRIGSTFGVALALITVLTLARSVAAGDQVPFKGSLEADVTHTPQPPLDFVLVEGEGEGTHLGAFTFEFPHVVNTTTRTASGTYEFTAANGDTLTADVIGRAMPSGTPGVLAIVEVATITGGTGRFAGATGNFTVERLYDTVNLTTTGSFEGTISVSGAGKR